MQMPGRNGNTGDYRYGFQGQETDDEVTGSESHVAFKYRVHDARLGRFLSLDPLSSSYPHNSPYAFAENRVIDAVELEGAEALDYRILAIIEQNVTVLNVNMDLAPKSHKGEWTRVESGRKWNARWHFSQALEIGGNSWWSAENAALIRGGDLPVADMHYLRRAGQGLSKVDFALLVQASTDARGNPEVLRHHHMKFGGVHGNFAVPLPKRVHGGSGNFSFWHNTRFRNGLRTTMRAGGALTILGAGLLYTDIANGKAGPANILGIPYDDGLARTGMDMIEFGILNNDYLKMRVGMTFLLKEAPDAFSVSYMTVDHFLEFTETGIMPTGTLDLDAPYGKSVTDMLGYGDVYPYMGVKDSGGKLIGILDVPDN